MYGEYTVADTNITTKFINNVFQVVQCMYMNRQCNEEAKALRRKIKIGIMIKEKDESKQCAKMVAESINDHLTGEVFRDTQLSVFVAVKCT